MKNVSIFSFLLVLFLISCQSKNDGKTKTFKEQEKNIINVENDITDIKTELFLGRSNLYIIDSFFIIQEFRPNNPKIIHLFNKNTFKYITSTGILGKGPREINRSGRSGVDRKNGVLWVQDHGKRVMWKFPLDSILNNKMYKPTKKIDLLKELFLVRLGFLNDSIALGKAVHVIDNGHFDMFMGKLNLNTGIAVKYGYEHPKAVGKKSNSQFALSVENNFYVNAYSNSDLITVCGLNGELKFNIYGPDWLKNENYRKDYFQDVDVIDNYIIASYVDDVSFLYDKNKRPYGNSPSRFLIFDLEGNYIKTIETGHKFSDFCVDDENNRVIVSFNDRENPLGYFNLNFD
jgi:hypothetical protein